MTILHKFYNGRVYWVPEVENGDIWYLHIIRIIIKYTFTGCHPLSLNSLMNLQGVTWVSAEIAVGESIGYSQ